MKNSKKWKRRRGMHKNWMVKMNEVKADVANLPKKYKRFHIEKE